jgi:alkanesulfonate monooxygenase SsuD/methylene tetrahydromethanopterin reductase-like flavin-dependent oxidoreductase (luciferase family)
MSQVFEEKDHIELVVAGIIPVRELGAGWLAFIEPGNLIMSAQGHQMMRVTVGLAGTEEDVLEQLRDLEARGFDNVRLMQTIKGKAPAFRLGNRPVYA